MTMHERYSPDYDLVDVMEKHQYGSWVRFDDYSTLKDHAEELARALAKMDHLGADQIIALDRYRAAMGASRDQAT